MGKILHWLQERIKHWTKPATSVLTIGILSDLTRSRADLVVENALLRQQLIILKRQVERPQLTNADRIHLVLLAHFTKFWKQTLHIIQPDTPHASASESVSHVLAAEVARQTKG